MSPTSQHELKTTIARRKKPCKTRPISSRYASQRHHKKTSTRGSPTMDHKKTVTQEAPTMDLYSQTTEVISACTTAISALNSDTSIDFHTKVLGIQRILMIVCLTLCVRVLYCQDSNQNRADEEIEERRRSRMQITMKERLLRMRTRHRIRLKRIQDRAPGKHFAGQVFSTDVGDSVENLDQRPTIPDVRRKLFC